MRDPDELDDTEREELAAIRQASETAETLYHLVEDFMRMVRCREGERLDAWLTHVTASPIPELRRLVRSINRDKAAVVAGLTLPGSQWAGRRPDDEAEVDQKDDVREGRVCPPSPTCAPYRGVKQACRQGKGSRGSRTQQVHTAQLPCNLRQNRVGYT